MTGDVGFVLANERDVPPVGEQSHMKVHCWRLVQMPSGTQHLVTLRNAGIARVTSPIGSIDHQKRTFTTSSGRVYVVVVPPEVAELERRVLKAAAASVLGTADTLDVSDAAWAQMCNDWSSSLGIQ